MATLEVVKLLLPFAWIAVVLEAVLYPKEIELVHHTNGTLVG